ncbi:hypothetical protein ATERTT37_002234 [Aspergillus terreus]
MPGKKAVVTLCPVGPAKPTTPRTLTFRSDADYVEIGRASKRESKNLLPQPNNALFDSRVMSRNHAKMWAAMDRKLIYIRDNDSMHGTWMDGSKLPVDEKVIIPNGAIIAFGVEVVRGRGTSPRLRTKPTNTFCVPDAEDDEEVQILNGPTFEDNSYSDHSNSGSDSDSEDMSVVEIPSPFTSPPKCDQHELTGTQQSPIEVDSEHEEEEQERQPLATPRMTPTPTSCVASRDETEVVDNTTHETDAPAAPQPPNEERSSKDPNDWEADHDEESDDVSDDQSAKENEQPAEEMNERPAKRLKTSGPSTLRAHATGAVVGAVVGAMGTIALLASLPQDYFL